MIGLKRRRADAPPARSAGTRRSAHLVTVGTFALIAALSITAAAPAAAAATPPAAAAATPPAQLGPTTAPGTTSQASTSSDIAANAGVVESAWDPQGISAPGGPFLRDSAGRVVMLHGVNVVYKHAPYELEIAPGRPFDFSSADAAAIAGAGFDVVRLGIFWQGLEPGGSPNDPSICSPGAPVTTHRFSDPVADAYLARVAAVVDLLGRYDIHTLLDMHQDLYAATFRGEGAPPWAVCTDNQPIVDLPGRWSRNYANPSLIVAVDHFWQNDVVGDLQGDFDQVWGEVAGAFKDNPWVVGYDPYNEPFSRQPGSPDASARMLECFYTGRLHPGLVAGTDTPLRCPATDPASGVVPTIEAADPTHLVFVEPDIYTDDGAPVLLGAMPFPRLVYNVHAYCTDRNPVTGDPSSTTACAADVNGQLSARDAERGLLASSDQPGGPPMFLSEFGATGDADLLGSVTATAAHLQLGWTYWSWKFYDDPTGSSDEPLATPDDHLLPQATALAVPYAEAIAGTPTDTTYDPVSRIFTLTFDPDPSISAPTVIVTTPARYPGGYCATVVGATIDSPPGAPHLLLANDPGANSVSFDIAPGACRSSSS